VNRIVINRVSVWEKDSRDECGYPLDKPFWKKIAGGPGFCASSKSHEKTSDQMKSLITGKLVSTHNVKVFENYNTLVFEDKSAYRYWISGETLNIVMRDFHHG